jgi:hypothetical protein
MAVILLRVVGSDERAWPARVGTTTAAAATCRAATPGAPLTVSTNGHGEIDIAASERVSIRALGFVEDVSGA